MGYLVRYSRFMKYSREINIKLWYSPPGQGSLIATRPSIKGHHVFCTPVDQINWECMEYDSSDSMDRIGSFRWYRKL